MNAFHSSSCLCAQLMSLWSSVKKQYRVMFSNARIFRMCTSQVVEQSLVIYTNGAARDRRRRTDGGGKLTTPVVNAIVLDDNCSHGACAWSSRRLENRNWPCCGTSPTAGT